MSVTARTDAAGTGALHPQVLAITSSLSLDRQLIKEDLIGSLAHVTMLAKQGLIPQESAKAIHSGLVSIWKDAAKGSLTLPDEEDVHMAVEVELFKRIGAAAQTLHSARSRNDQVATDLRLFVREQCATIIERVTKLVKTLIARAEKDGDIVLPSYTHRQRAQPVSLAYWFGAWAEGFARDAELFRFALSGADVSPLGVGAISGTSLGTDRAFTQGLLQFTGLSGNGLDTVGDRDFALDYLYATARLLTRVGRMSTDVIDFSSSEFGFVKLSSDIACGSSMMPQKKNPDVFEILRGKSGMAIGALTGLFATVKGLPGGYNRDLQEDRGPILETAVRLDQSLTLLEIGLDGISFDAERCLAAVSDGSTQATDLAEALVKRGVAFRQAYQAVGSLVRVAKESGTPLAKVTVEAAAKVDPRFDAQVLATLSPREAQQRKESAGGTGTKAVKAQLAALSKKADALAANAAQTPRLSALFASLEKAF